MSVPPWCQTRSEVDNKISRRMLLDIVSKHFAAGSECPPLPAGLSRIYSMEYCPYAQRARLVALAKNLPHDVVNINLKSKPDWFLQMYPEGKIPVLQHQDDIVGDSIAICDYLELKIPNPILAHVAYRKCDQKLRKDWGRIVGLMTRITFGNNLRNEGGVSEVICKLHKYLGAFEKALRDRNTIYFNGDVPGIMDYIMWAPL
ncbi:glutathione S-transferase omega-1-like [Ctenocephalides felis]|uniref:glutathione S-transferase omega-1-like n=1 Tax=Ctenocephalides felis TaxID=7515 RepID=UPI000E6E3B81|nr:glutathione S-transferase omega-1-like [Ctenocephalides felis]